MLIMVHKSLNYLIFKAQKYTMERSQYQSSIKFRYFIAVD